MLKTTDKTILRSLPSKPGTPMMTASSLPTLPGYVFRLNQLLSDKEPDLDAVTQVIRTDAGLAAQALRLANLYLPESCRPICSVKDAVDAIGVQRLRTLVITCPLLDCAADIEQKSALQSFWQHSVMVADLSESIAAYLDYPDPEMAYTAGLLRDIGELPLIALAQRDGTAWPEVSSAGRDRRAREAGRRLAIACKLTPQLVEVCGCDDPLRAWHDPLLLKIVAAAGQFCAANGLISGGAPQQLRLSLTANAVSATLMKLFALGPRRACRLTEVISQRFLSLIPALEFNHAGLLMAAGMKRQDFVRQTAAIA